MFTNFSSAPPFKVKSRFMKKRAMKDPATTQNENNLEGIRGSTSAKVNIINGCIYCLEKTEYTT